MSVIAPFLSVSGLSHVNGYDLACLTEGLVMVMDPSYGLWTLFPQVLQSDAQGLLAAGLAC